MSIKKWRTRSVSAAINGNGKHPHGSTRATRAPHSMPRDSSTVDLFAYVASNEEGLAAPGDVIARPAHPTLNGALYASQVPSRESRYPLSLTTKAYDFMGETYSLRSVGLRLYQDKARHATQIRREAGEAMDRKCRERRAEARAAREAYLRRAEEVRAAKLRATEEERAELRSVEDEIRVINRRAVAAHAKPGVPRARTQRMVETSTAIQLQERDSVAGAGAAATGAATKDGKEDTFPSEPLGAMLSKAALGTVVGLALGTSHHYLVLHRMLRFTPTTLPWMLVWMWVGIAIIWFLSVGMSKWWDYAGARHAEEAHTPDVVNWHSIRHTLPPLAATVTVCVIEMSVLMTAQVASPIVRDPNHWTYIFGNMAFVLPANIYAGVSGWRRGRGQRLAQFGMEREEARRLEKLSKEQTKCWEVEESIVASAEAQEAFALDDYIEILGKRREELIAIIERIEAHYDILMSHYIADMEAPTSLSAEELMILDGLRKDAEAAHVDYLKEHAKYEEALEPLPQPPPENSRITLCVVRAADGQLPPTTTESALAKKTTLWQRILAFFRRVIFRKG